MRRRVYIFWSIFVAAAIFRIWQSFDVKAPDIGSCLKEVVSGVGTVSDEPSSTETGQVLLVSVENLHAINNSEECPTDFLIRLKTKLYPRFVYEDRVTFTGKLLQPANFSSGSDRTFDYRGYLAKDDVYYEMRSATVSATNDFVSPFERSSTSSFPLADSAKTGGTTSLAGVVHSFQSLPGTISSWLYALKRAFVGNLEKTLGEPHAALASGLVVGEKVALGKDLLNDFRIVGLIHIVVLSGYNITVVGDAMRRLLGRLPRIWGIVIGGIGIMLFGILVGGGATVVRSCFMAGIALSADLIRRDYNVARALVFVALIMLIQNPMILLHDPSFQLSFLATFGLILLASPIEKYLTFIPETFSMRGIVASTFATQIFISPYIFYMMGQLSVIGVVVNILVLPFIPVTMLAVFLTGMVGLVSLPIAQVLAWGAHLLLSYELFMVNSFARLPFASVHIPAFSFWWVVGFYGVFGVIYWRKELFLKTRNTLIADISVKVGSGLLELFEGFVKLPKGILIDDPHALISTDYKIEIETSMLGLDDTSIFFTRRTLKHLSEKGIEGKLLFSIFPDVLKYPDTVYRRRGKRILIAKSTGLEKEGRFYIVVLEPIENRKLIIVTAFVAKQKYLKNFEILWRTAASSPG